MYGGKKRTAFSIFCQKTFMSGTELLYGINVLITKKTVGGFDKNKKNWDDKNS
jgi:hypothetical protein